MKTLITFLLLTFSLTTFSQNQIEFDKTDIQIESIRKKSKEIEEMTKEMDLIFLENKIMIIERKVSELEEKVKVQNRTLKEKPTIKEYTKTQTSLLYVGIILIVFGMFGLLYNLFYTRSAFIFVNHIYSTIPAIIGLLIFIFINFL